MIMWWAYVHSHDNSIHLKRWFPVGPGMVDDLEWAKQEMLLGNDNIKLIVSKPFDAYSHEEAMNKAKEIFNNMSPGIIK